MPAISVSKEVFEKLTALKNPEKPYDHVIRELLGMAMPQRKTEMQDHADYKALVALEVGKSCILAFERPNLQIPVGDGSNGELTVDQQKVSHRDMSPTNLRHLAQVVRRVQEATGYQLFVEGRPRGQLVTRVR